LETATLLLQDLWFGKQPIFEQYPILYSIVSDKGASLMQKFTAAGTQQKWRWFWCRILSSEEEE
jgi:hypothetical protein